MTKRKLINELSKELARLEGKKSQARIGDIREILSLLIKLCAEELAEKCKDMELKLSPQEEVEVQDLMFVRLYTAIGRDTVKISDKKKKAKK